MITKLSRLFTSRLKHFLVVKYAITLGLCLWAMSIQSTYRVPSQFLFVILPWVGSVLTLLSSLFLIKHLVRLPEIDPFQKMIEKLEWSGTIFIRIFLYYSLILFANARLDPSPVTYKESQITSISGSQLDLGLPVSYSWLTIESWETPGLHFRLLLNKQQDRSLWAGEQIVVRLREGFFGIPWVREVKKDEAHYARETIKLAPNAIRSWKQLINFSITYERWEEALKSIAKYKAIAPEDYKFFGQVGTNLVSRLRLDEGIPILEDATAHRPDYRHLNVLGWGYFRSGDKTRAEEVYKRAIALEPNSYLAYFQLGRLYAYYGRFQEALETLKKAAELRPGDGYIEYLIRGVKRDLNQSQV